MSSTIEPARPSDFLNVAALDRVAWLHTGEKYIADGEHAWRVWIEYGTVLVARGADPVDESEDIAGALLMFPTKVGEIFLHKIMVHPQRRGQGLGSELMRSGLAQASAPVLLTVDPSNDVAVRLYEGFGFQIRERVKGYYRSHEDRLLMAYTPGMPVARGQ